MFLNVVCHIVFDTHDSDFQNCKSCVANTKQGIGHHHTFRLLDVNVYFLHTQNES
jgi:hypothetical protein